MMTVETTKGSVEIKAQATEALHEGVLSIPHGWGGKANANQLTSYEPRDPVTGYKIHEPRLTV